MVLVFPTALFAPNDVDFDIEKRTVAGGTALNGEEDLIVTDGGGRWAGTIADVYLDDPIVGKAYRALSALSDGGATPFAVPFCDHRYQPDSSARATVPHSDGTPFSDDTEYSQEGSGVTVAAEAALRATTMVLAGLDLMADPLVGGETFSIDHPTLRYRAYRVATVEGAVITFRPPLRESVVAGTEVSFDPICMMRLEGEMRSPVSLGGFIDAPPIRFVEHFPGPGGY
jgi:hypothetical protein